MSQKITLEAIRTMHHPTDKFLCPLKANKYALQFLNFEIKNQESGQIFYSHEQEVLPNSELLINDDDYPPEMLHLFDEMRTMNYNFPEEFVRSRIITSKLVFKVGDLPLKDLTILDKFYFQKEIVKSFEFKFPFCVPNSKNEWEYIYEFPDLDEKTIQAMIHSPGKTFSETFFFAGDELILHNKANYAFSSKE